MAEGACLFVGAKEWGTTTVVCREYRTSLAWGTFGGCEWYSSNLGLVIVASASLCDLAVTQERLHKTALHLACQVELVAVGGG
jgi:hypothetical protein